MSYIDYYPTYRTDTHTHPHNIDRFSTLENWKCGSTLLLHATKYGRGVRCAGGFSSATAVVGITGVFCCCCGAFSASNMRTATRRNFFLYNHELNEGAYRLLIVAQRNNCVCILCLPVMWILAVFIVVGLLHVAFFMSFFFFTYE